MSPLTSHLPARTSLVVVFDTAHSYPVTARVGPFNASYVKLFFDYLNSLAPNYPFKVLPYAYFGEINDLISNYFYATTADPIQCEPENENTTAFQCAAYLLSGGVVDATP